MTTPFDDDVALAEFAAAQQREYGKWEAVDVIWHGNARAYNPGDAVPVSNVERLGYAKNKLVQLQQSYVDANPDDPDVARQTRKTAKTETKADQPTRAAAAPTSTTKG
jgi:hypothetical protein